MSVQSMPRELRRASFEVLVPLAAVAPLPLFWTDGASGLAIILYEISLLALWRWTRKGRPPRLSNAVLNVFGLAYLFWLGFEAIILRHGLLKSITHLLLFTAVAKLASLKRPGEVRTALLVIFLITLASASSSTHISSFLYFGAMALLGFRALARLAVLADFGDGPPREVLHSVPTGGMAAAAILCGAVLTVPLFYGLPRLRRPFAVPPFRVTDALSSTLAADRVDLNAFSAAKRSEQVVLRMEVDPETALPRVLRLREAVFTRYRRGIWTRSDTSPRAADRAERPLAETRAQQHLVGRVSMDLNLNVNGFLFLPYGAERLEVEGEIPAVLRDGVVVLTHNVRSVRYTADIRGVEPRAVGSSVIDPDMVPKEIRDYAMTLTGDLTDPHEIYARIRQNFMKRFVYTLDPPRVAGDPVVNFLLRSRAGHCEFFASATALMLTARGIPARLVTGSFGGEVGLFSRALVVRGGNLHAWVEAQMDEQGFTVLDPTPDAGIPPAESRVSWTRFFSNLAHEIEYFYDRRILGFDSLEQIRIAEAIRDVVSSVGQGFASWKQFVAVVAPRRAAVTLGVLGAVFAAFVLLRRSGRRVSAAAATRAYLSLRRLLAARTPGGLPASVPPMEVARRLGDTVPAAREDAAAVASIYCAATFGGRPLTPESARDLSDRVKRLKKIA